MITVGGNPAPRELLLEAWRRSLSATSRRVAGFLVDITYDHPRVNEEDLVVDRLAALMRRDDLRSARG